MMKRRELIATLQVIRNNAQAALHQLEVDEESESAPRTAALGELAAIRDQLARVARQLRRLHPLPGDRRRRRAQNGTEDDTSSAVPVLAEIRAFVDELEDRIASVLPAQHSGRTHYRFHGSKHVSPEDGEAIRADVRALPREAVYRKWCNKGKFGVSGGEGEYTKIQVATVLANESGKHRLRRHRARERAASST